MTLRAEVRKFFSAARPVVKAHTINSSNSIGQSILLIVSVTGSAVLRSKALSKFSKNYSISETGSWGAALRQTSLGPRSRILTTINSMV